MSRPAFIVHVICFYKSMSCIFVESRLLLIVSKLTFVGMGKCGLISLKSLPFTLWNILYFLRTFLILLHLPLSISVLYSLSVFKKNTEESR